MNKDYTVVLKKISYEQVVIEASDYEEAERKAEIVCSEAWENLGEEDCEYTVHDILEG